jgi:hypothetical protein
MSQQITVVSAAQMPCDCMPGPYQCNVPTEAQLPVCNRNGVVYTITAQPGMTQPYQVFCWNGVWYRMMDTARIRGYYLQTVDQTFDVLDSNVTLPGGPGEPDNFRSGQAVYSNINAVYDPYGLRISSTTLRIPKTGHYLVNAVYGISTAVDNFSGFSPTFHVRLNGVDGFPRARTYGGSHGRPNVVQPYEVTFAQTFSIGDNLTFVGGIEDSTYTADYVAKLTDLYVAIVEI